jgi:APA family basic amino acid/polyamine antiporter
MIIVIGFMNYGTVSVDFFQVEASNAILGILSAAALIFFAYIGFEDIANIAEETENPSKTIPRALMLSIVVTTILYVLVALAIASAGIAPGDLATSVNPFADIAAGVLGSEAAVLVISIIALFATANTVLVMLIVGSRMMYGMSKAGALPKAFSKIHNKTNTPWVAIIFAMIISIGFVFFGDIEIVARASVFAVFIVFFIINITLIYLRKSQPELERPFKVRPNIKWIPIFPLIGAITCFLMLWTFADSPNDYILILIIQGIVTAVGIGFYLLYKLYRHWKNKPNLSS